jgi:hypothetical protein
VAWVEVAWHDAARDPLIRIARLAGVTRRLLAELTHLDPRLVHEIASQAAEAQPSVVPAAGLVRTTRQPSPEWTRPGRIDVAANSRPGMSMAAPSGDRPAADAHADRDGEIIVSAGRVLRFSRCPGPASTSLAVCSSRISSPWLGPASTPSPLGGLRSALTPIRAAPAGTGPGR